MEAELKETLEGLIARVNKLPEKDRAKTVLDMEDVMRGLNYYDGDTLDGFVFRTSDLTQFATVKGNRIINEESVFLRELSDSIAEHGIITPIVVNEKKQIIDGQRRIRAIRKFGLPNAIRYTRVDQSNIDTVGEVNRLQIKWTFRDWLHKYVELKNPHYAEYDKIAEIYEDYVTSRSLRSLLMNARFESFSKYVWERGQFTINKEKLPKVQKYLNMMVKVYAIGDKDNLFARDRNFQKALYDLYKDTEDFDDERMLSKIRYGYGTLNIRTGYKEYKRILSRLYNSKLDLQKSHIVFDAD